MIYLGLTLFAALLATLLATPLVRAAARRLGVVDRPDGVRKLHAHEVPLGGGFAVLIGLVAGTAAVLATSSRWSDALADSGWLLPALLASAVLISLVGLLDDSFQLRGRQKLAGQVLAVGILTLSGLVIREVHVFDWRIELGLLAVPFTLFWLLGAINALNLIDGIDGLASSVGIILSLAVAAMSLLTGHLPEALLATALAGALAGFLVYNAPPASVFLGDAGSMLIGLVVGVLAIRCSLKGPATVALAAPLALWSIPILDVTMAIIRRKLTGRSIYTSDHGHLHHCLRRRGQSGPQTVVWIGLLCSLTAGGALASVLFGNELLAIGTVAAVVGTLIVSRIFGHAEFVLLYRRARSALVSLITRRHDHSHPDTATVTRLDGNQHWEAAWEQLVELAKQQGYDEIRLNVQAPFLHEDFHALWRQSSRADDDSTWQTELPLVNHRRTICRLTIRGHRPAGSSTDWLHQLADELKPIERHLQSLLAESAAQHETSTRFEHDTIADLNTHRIPTPESPRPLPGTMTGEVAGR